MTTEIVCSGCFKLLPLDAFHRGEKYRCKPCYRKRDNAYRYARKTQKQLEKLNTLSPTQVKWLDELNDMRVIAAHTLLHKIMLARFGTLNPQLAAACIGEDRQ